MGKDDLRAMLDNGQWSRKNEQFVHRVQQKIIQLALDEGYDIVVDNTHLKQEHRENLMNIAHLYKADFECKDFSKVPLKTCLSRDSLRPSPVGENVIRAMNTILLKKI